MDRNQLRIDRRTLLRAASFLAAIPAGEAAADPDAEESDESTSGSETVAVGAGGDAAPTPAPTRPSAYDYGGRPVAAATDRSGRADAADPGRPARQGYGEYGYGGVVP